MNQGAAAHHDILNFTRKSTNQTLFQVFIILKRAFFELMMPYLFFSSQFRKRHFKLKLCFYFITLCDHICQMCFGGFAREMCHENKYTIPKRHFKQMDNVNTLHNRYILRGDNQDIYIPAHVIIDPIRVLLIRTSKSLLITGSVNSRNQLERLLM